MKNYIDLRLVLFGLLKTLVCSLDAQNTSSVFSPNVTKGASDVEYRLGYEPEGDALAQRIHYQYGITDTLRLRGIVQFNQSDTESFGFQYFRQETQWQFLKEAVDGWDSALRFEIQIPDNSHLPYRARLGWTGLVNLDENWQLRGNALLGKEFGPDRDPGFGPEGRAQISRKLNKHIRLAVDWFGDFNDTEDIGSYEEQEHQLGPLLKVKAGDGWSANIGALWGISRAAPNIEYRFILTYGF